MEKGNKINFKFNNRTSFRIFCNTFSLIVMSGEYDIAGSMGLYEREHEVEKLKVPGPIKFDISLYVSLNLFC